MDKAIKIISIFSGAVRDSYNILLPQKTSTVSENGPTKDSGSTYYIIDNIFDYDGSYKYEFALRTPFHKIKNSKWSTFWSEEENPDYKIRLNNKYSTCFRKSKIPVYMKQSDFENKFGVELTKVERESPTYLRALYVEGLDERIQGIFDVKELLLSPRIAAIMKRRYRLEWTEIEDSLIYELGISKTRV